MPHLRRSHLFSRWRTTALRPWLLNAAPSALLLCGFELALDHRSCVTVGTPRAVKPFTLDLPLQDHIGVRDVRIKIQINLAFVERTDQIPFPFLGPNVFLLPDFLQLPVAF